MAWWPCDFVVSVCLFLAAVSMGTGQAQDEASIRLVNGSHPWEGRLELLVNGSWGPFCDMFWGPEEAEVACRQLGFNTSHVKHFTGSFFGRGALQRVWTDRYLRCAGGEASLADCRVERSTSCNRWPGGVAGVSCDTTQDTDDCVDHGCLHDGICRDQNRYYTCLCVGGYTGPRCETDIDDCARFNKNPCKNGATCYDHPGHFTCACPPEFTGRMCEVRLTPGHGSLRLVNGSHPGEGRVEVLVEGVWGAICDTGWDVADTRVVCRQLGYNTSAVRAYTGAYFGEMEIDKIWTTEVKCTGNETRLVDCEARAYDRGNACRRRYTVGVSCDTTQDTDDCKNHECKHGAPCYDKNREYVCSCRGGYSGRFCEIGVTISARPYKDEREDEYDRFYCSSAYTPSKITWVVATTSGQTLELGTCTSSNNCTSPYSPDVIVSWSSDRSIRSYVTFAHMKRDFGGQVFCNYTNDGLVESANTTINVYNSGELQNCSVELARHNWSFVMVCDITNVFSSAGIYDYRVDQGFNVRIGVDRKYARGFVFEGRRSYRDVLAPYVSDGDGKTYYRGRLVFSWPVAPTPGHYTDFRLVRHYGFSYFHGSYITDQFTVATPSNVTHNCTDLSYIPETGAVPCVCFAGNLGTPEGRLSWVIGNVTIATGDYGVQNLSFPSGQVSRRQDGMMAACQLDWIEPTAVPVTKHVAYGPDSVVLNVIESRDVSNNLQLLVISRVTGMKPMTSDMVQWGGVCQGQTGFTCTLTPKSAAEVDGKSVTCRAFNAANNGHSVEGSAVIKLRETETLDGALKEKFVGNSKTDSNHYKTVAIILGIALAVVTIAFVIVIFIFCRRDRSCGHFSYGTMTGHRKSSRFSNQTDLDVHGIIKDEDCREREGGAHVNADMTMEENEARI